MIVRIKLQLHDAIYRLRFYSNSLIYILSHSNSRNNVASLEKNRGDKSHSVIVALSKNGNLSATVQFMHSGIFIYIRCNPLLPSQGTSSKNVQGCSCQTFERD